MNNRQQMLWQDGQRFTQQQKWDKAALAYQAIVAIAPGHVPAWLELSDAMEKLDRYRAAHAAIRSAADVTTNIPPMMGLAVARKLRKFEEIALLHDYLDKTALPSRLPPERLVDLAMFVSSGGGHQQALGWIEQALRARPNLVEAHNMLGLLRMFAGDMAGAAQAFERTILLKPSFAAVYSVLSRAAPVGQERNHVALLRGLLAKPGLAKRDEVHLGYALHNELHELGDYDQAWRALERACKAKQAIQPYDPAQTVRLFQALRQGLDADAMHGEPAPDPLVPIFIIGMYRSGTTLLERILSGHPDVADAGETYTFSAQLRLASDHFCATTADEAMLAPAAGFDYPAIGRGFLDAIRWRAGGRPFITEKLNANFILSGPIAKALPQARLLHMRRDPADTCFSNLRTLFTAEAPYSYDPIQVADYYKAYADLMAHWREIAPARIFDIDYDALVQSPREQAERIAQHCGLAFDERMLDVQRESGMVVTASFHTVRKGIMTNRARAWEPYQRQLQPMLDRLASHGLL